MGFASPYRMPGFRPLAGAPSAIVVELEEAAPEWDGCARGVDGHVAGVVALPEHAPFRKRHVPVAVVGAVILVASFYVLFVDADPAPQPRASDARSARVASSAGK